MNNRVTTTMVMWRLNAVAMAVLPAPNRSRDSRPLLRTLQLPHSLIGAISICTKQVGDRFDKCTFCSTRMPMRPIHLS
jgi:hypothetical protein